MPTLVEFPTGQVSPAPDQMDPLLNLLKQRPPQDWSWRFEPTATSHNPTNAVALCNASILTYSTQQEVIEYLGRWGFTHVAPLRGSRTQGFVARRERTIIVAFRGTEPVNAVDWLSDVNYHHRWLVPENPPRLGLASGVVPAGVPGGVHGGFGYALDEVLDPMVKAVQTFLSDGADRIFCTGHSLGGALTVLGAAVLRLGLDLPVAGVYTYGQPRAGDPEFSRAFDQVLGEVTFRYVNGSDIVPHVPPARLPAALALHPLPSPVGILHTAWGVPAAVAQKVKKLVEGERFAHVGQLMLFLDDGTVTHSEAAWKAREVIYSGELSDLFKESRSLLRFRFGQLLREDRRIVDHDPLNGYLPRLGIQAGI